jgi:hypothetical protein
MPVPVYTIIGILVLLLLTGLSLLRRQAAEPSSKQAPARVGVETVAK